MSDDNKLVFRLQVDGGPESATALAQFINGLGDAANKVQVNVNAAANNFKNLQTGAGAGFETLSGGLRALLGPVAALGTAAGAVMAFKQSIEEAAETESSVARLRAEMEMTAGDAKPLMIAFDGAAASNRQYAVTLRQSADAAREFQERGLSPVQSFQAIQFAAKLARAENVNFETAVQSLGMTMQFGIVRPGSALGAVLGSMRTELRDAGDAGQRFDIIMSGAGDKIQKLADVQMGTAAGQMALLNQQVNQLSANLGSLLLPMATRVTTALNNGFVEARAFMAALDDMVKRTPETHAELLKQESALTGIPQPASALGNAAVDAANAAAVEHARQERIATTAAEMKTQGAAALAEQVTALQANDKLEAADRAQRYQLDSEAQRGDVAKRLETIRAFYQDELKAAAAAVEKENALREQGIAAHITNGKKLAPNASDKDLRDAVTRIGGGQANYADEIAGKYGISEDQGIQKFVGSLKEAAKLQQQITADQAKLSSQAREVQPKTVADMSKAVDESGSDAARTYQDKLTVTKDKLAGGEISDVEASRRDAVAAGEYSDTIEGKLIPALSQLQAEQQAETLADGNTGDAALRTAEKIGVLQGKVQALSDTIRRGSFFGQLGADMEKFLTELGDVERQMTQAFQGIVNAGINGVSNAMMGLITKTKTAGQAFQEMGLSMIEILIQMAVKLVIANVLMAILDALTGGTAGPAMGGMMSGLMGLKHGGIVHAAGGFVNGPGGSTDDRIPAMLSNGEAVIPAGVVAQNPELIQRMISGAVNLNDMASQIPSAIAAPIGGSAAYAAAGGGFNGNIHVSPADVHVVVANTPQQMRNYISSTEGQKHIFDIMRNKKLDLGLMS